MLKKILVAFDGSPSSKIAYAQGLEFAKSFKAELHVLAVIVLQSPVVDCNALVATATQYYQKQYAELQTQNPSNGIFVNLTCEIGEPADTVVLFAEKNNIELIILGATRGESMINRLILGSVSSKVVEKATCSVMVVR